MTVAVDSSVDALQRSGVLDGLALYAFGHTAATEQLRRRLQRDGLRLTAILDNNPIKQGASLGDVPIIAPQEVIAHSGPSVVLIASRFHDEMRRQLLDLGYAQENIVRVGDLSITTATPAAGARDRGTRLLERLRLTHPGRHLLVCPFGALGDVYWALAYLPAFASRRRLAQAVPVVVGEACEQVARLLGHTDVVSLTQSEIDDLVAELVACCPPDATIAHHDRPYGPDAPVRVLDDRFVSFIDLYRDVVYGLPADAQPLTPPRRADHRVQLAGLPRGRTVLLAPYAKSVVGLAPSFWEDLAERHARDGDAVATLVHGDEAPVAGTVALEVAIADLLDVTEYAGTFIALRSGLCDVVHCAHARKVHVSPDAYYSTTRHKVADFFALPGWESVVVPVS